MGHYFYNRITLSRRSSFWGVSCGAAASPPHRDLLLVDYLGGANFTTPLVGGGATRTRTKCYRRRRAPARSDEQRAATQTGGTATGIGTFLSESLAAPYCEDVPILSGRPTNPLQTRKLTLPEHQSAAPSITSWERHQQDTRYSPSVSAATAAPPGGLGSLPVRKNSLAINHKVMWSEHRKKRNNSIKKY